jgi:hypothetical protein
VLQMWSGFRTRCKGASGDSDEASSAATSHGGGGTAAGSGLAHWRAGGRALSDQCGRGVAPCAALTSWIPSSAGLGTSTFGLAGAVPRRSSPRGSGAAALAVDSQGGTGGYQTTQPCASMDAGGRGRGSLETGGGWIRQRRVHRGHGASDPGYPGASWMGLGAQPVSGPWGLSGP